ncbi:MAG: efflux RND transporter periplasmic adaptor subunit [Psychromonas sp.]
MKRLTRSILSGAVICSLTACGQSEPVIQEETTSRPVQVIELASAAEQNTKQFSGVIHSQNSAGLAFRIPGTVDQLLVKKGQSVDKGQVIARLDPHDYQVALEELEARALEAKSAKKLATSELARIKQAIADDAIADVNLDRAVSGYERSAAAVKVINKNIQRANDTLSYTELKAPFSGVIGKVNIEQHEQVLPGLAILTLQKNNKLEVDIDVPENLIHEFELNQQAQVSWFKSSSKIDAKITEIATLPHLIKQTYTVTLSIENSDESLFPGKAVTVTTKMNTPLSATCLPYSALVGKDSLMHVNVVRDNKVTHLPVEVESLAANQACVSGEFVADDYVVVSGSNYLLDGAYVPKLTVRVQ